MFSHHGWRAVVFLGLGFEPSFQVSGTLEPSLRLRVAVVSSVVFRTVVFLSRQFGTVHSGTAMFGTAVAVIFWSRRFGLLQCVRSGDFLAANLCFFRRTVSVFEPISWAVIVF